MNAGTDTDEAESGLRSSGKCRNVDGTGCDGIGETEVFVGEAVSIIFGRVF